MHVLTHTGARCHGIWEPGDGLSSSTAQASARCQLCTGLLPPTMTCSQDGSCDTVLRGQGNVWLTKQERPDARTLVALEQLPDDNLAAATASAQHLLSKLAAPSA